MAALTWNNIVKVAKWLNVDPCAVQAVVQVESQGNGFLPDGRPKILFEGHVFWKMLEAINHKPIDYLTRRTYIEKFGDLSDILYPKQTNAFYIGGIGEYDRLARAKHVHNMAGLKAASWGTFQIMGFNYAVCGYSTVFKFVDAMRDGYPGQMEAFGGFLIGNNLVQPLREHDWAAFAKGYNGLEYAKDKYDERIAQAYDQCSLECYDDYEQE